MGDGLKILNLEEIAAAQDIETEIVPVPEWGEDAAVKVRGLTKAAQARVRSKALHRDGEVDIEASQMYMMLEGLVEPKISPADFALFRGKRAGAVDRIITAIGRLSGINADATLSAEAVDEAEATFPQES